MEERKIVVESIKSLAPLELRWLVAVTHDVRKLNEFPSEFLR